LSTEQTNDADGSANDRWKTVDRPDDDDDDADDLCRPGEMTKTPTVLV
jgi:hypothetical protein